MDEKLAKAADAWLCAERNRAASKANGGLPGLDLIAARYDAVAVGWLLMALSTKRGAEVVGRAEPGVAQPSPFRQGMADLPGESEEL